MDGGIHFDVTADDANFQAKISAIKQGVSDASKLMENAFRAAQSSSDKSTKSIEGNFLKMSDSMEELPKIINDQKNAISQLEKQYKKVQDSFNKLSPSKAKAVLGEEMNSIKKTIDEEKEALRQLVEKQKEYNQSNISVRTQMTNVRNEMTQLELAGQKNSARYRELEQELGRLGTAYGKIQYEQRALSTGATQWGGIISGIQGLSGAFAAAQGVIGLFVTDNKELAKIQTRLQAVMAITIGMQQVSNTLHETSAFRMTTVRRVTELYAAAQTKLATSLGISAVAAKVLMASLTLGLSVAITAIIALISKWSSSQKKAAEEQRHIIEVQKKFLDTTGGQIAVYEKLRKGWNDLGNNLAAKKKFITENADEFKKLGIAISGVKDAENLLVKNRDAFLESLNQRAMAAASMELATEKYKEVLKKKLELSSTSKTTTKTMTYGSSVTGGMRTESYEVENKEYTRLEKEIEIAQKSADSFIQKNIESISKSNEILAKAGLNTITQSEQAENEAEKRRKLQEKLDSELLAIQKQNQEDEIDLMEEGTDKKLAQIEHDFEEQKKAIEKHKSDIAKFNKELGTEGLNEEGLTSEQQNFISKRIFLVSKRYEMETETAKGEQPKLDKTAMNEYLKEYGDYMEKRNAIIELYNEKIANAKTKGEQLSLGKQMEKELAGVDDEARRKTSIITKLFDDMSGKVVADMRAIADEAEKMLAYLNGGEFKLDDSGNGIFGLTREQFNILVQSPEKLESIKNEIENVRKEADAAEPAFKKVANGLKSIFSSGSNPSEFKKALSDIQNGLNEVMQAAGFLSDSLKSLGDSFGSNALGGIAEGIDITMGVLDAGMKGAEAGSVFGPIGAAAGAALGVVTSLSSAIAGIHDKKNEKRIQRLQDQINILEKSYDKLGDSIEEAYSKDASGLIEDQNKLLEQQKILIQQQIREEEKKKKTNKGRIEEWEKEIEEIDKVIEENKEKAVNAIFGEDLKSAIENFAEAYADAWSSGEDKAVSAKETVKKMMKQMVIESIKAAIQASGSMEKIRQKLQEFYSDNVLSDWEQEYIYKMAEEAQKELDAQFGWADKLLGDSSSYSQEASSKGFQAMSQDVGEELNGRFTALQISNEEIKNQMLNVVSHLSMMASVSTENNAVLNDMLFQQVLSNGYLEDIARHTKLLNSMKTTLEKVRDNTGRL